jgi:hypothetical protein
MRGLRQGGSPHLESVRVAHFNVEDQAEARQFDSVLLEEWHNTALANVQKYQASLKWYYNKSVVTRELNVEDLVVKMTSTPETSISSHHPGNDHSS